MKFDRQARTAFVVAIVLLGGSHLTISSIQKWMGVVLHKESVPMRQEFSSIPQQLENWKSTIPDGLLDEATLDSLGTRMYLNRVYDPIENDAPQIQVHLAYYTGMIDPVPHVPGRCFVAGGLEKVSSARIYPLSLKTDDWQVHEDRVNQATGLPYRTAFVKHQFTGERHEVTMPIGEFQWRATEFRNPRIPGLKIFAGYLFIANGRVTPSPEGVRLMAFDLHEPSAYYCKIQLTVMTKTDLQTQGFVDLSADFLEEFLPEAMRCLPDWWAQESAIEKVAIDASDE